MKKPIGEYFLGRDWVRVFIDTKSNDGFAQLPGHWYREGKIRTGFLSIGIDQSYEDTVGVLLHEAAEFAAVQLGLRYHVDLGSRGPSLGIFLMSHDQYSELTERIGPFVAQCLPDLNKAYRKYYKK